MALVWIAWLLPRPHFPFLHYEKKKQQKQKRRLALLQELGPELGEEVLVPALSLTLFTSFSWAPHPTAVPGGLGQVMSRAL